MTSHTRVLALIDTAMVSGPGRQLAALAQALRSHEVVLTIGCVVRAGRADSAYLGYLNRLGVPAFPVRESGPFDARLPGRVAALASEVGADLIQTHSYKTTVALGLLRSTHRLRVPWVAFFHGATSENWRVRLYNRIDRLFLPSADRLVTMSLRDAASFRRTRVPVGVIYNAILPVGAGLPPEESERLEALPRPRFLFLGRLSHEKGLDLLLLALRQASQSLREATLLVVGDGPDRSRLQALSNTLPAGIEVHFLGHRPHGAAFLEASDCLVIPSRSEGLPNALLEAAAMNRPGIVASVGAIPEVVEPGDPYCLVPPGDEGALAEALVGFAAHGISGDAAHLRARLSLERRVECHLQLYRELLESPGGRAH